MKFGILSDLHLHFDKKWDFVPEDGVFYLCAGDIIEEHNKRKLFLEKHENHMFSVMGNHDFYRSSFWIGPGHTKTIKDVKIAGATLWTEMKEDFHWNLYVNGLNDFAMINFMSEKAYKEAHSLQKDFLFKSNADIIVSHHAPSKQAIHPKWELELCNHCFCNDLDEQILSLEKPPKLWVFGHIHDPCWFYIGKTLCIANPKGYPHESNFYEYVPYILDMDNLPSKEEVMISKWSPPFLRKRK